MKKITWLLPLVVVTIYVHAQKKEDRKTIGNLQLHINYLSSDKLEGRSTGAPGEQLAAAYIAAQMQQNGLTPMGEDGFLQTFTIKETREPAATCHMTINEDKLLAGKQFLPLPFSAEKPAKGEAMPGVNEPDNIWLINVAEIDTDSQKSMLQLYLQQTQIAEKSGASGVVFYNGKETIAEVLKWLEQHPTPTGIPAVWVSNDVSKKLNAEDAGSFQVNIQIAFKAIKRSGTNVIGYINNKAPRTIIIGAHYDYRGWETTSKAEDNASGTAALLEIARLLNNSRLHNNNYIIVAFSGKEQGLSGSKYFAAHSTVNLSQVNYMINMDGIGQLNPGTALQIGGTGTSPGWAAILQQATTKELPLVYDSSGIYNSDHASFYKKNIPVLYFSTSTATSENKINYDGTLNVLKLVYNIIDKTNDKDKLAFTGITN
ncbi:M28 family peptidase [Chitinophaga sp. RAB17]|uniref:M28 family peptidase n=1 Tax=Chitinophaga sp. RAB17 TaxID=3233049 RepID=UPI003F901E51